MKICSVVSLLMFILFLITLSCNNKSQDTSNQREKAAIAIKDTICEFPSDTFKFKEFKLGLDISDFKNLKKQAGGGHSIVLDNKCYDVTNPQDYSMFGSKIQNISLCFYKNKLYQIDITCSPSVDLTELFFEKYNIPTDCLVIESDKANSSETDVSNKYLRVNCKYSNGLHFTKKDAKFFELHISDLKIEEQIHADENEVGLKEKQQSLKDF